MSRIVNSDTPGKKRTGILKLLVNLMPIFQTEKPSKELRNDVIAFIVMSLEEVEKTIEDTIRPWEKRDYWTKAERFSAEWRWVGTVKNKIVQEEENNGWTKWPTGLNELYTHLVKVNPTRKKMGEFWAGSYRLYNNQKDK